MDHRTVHATTGADGTLHLTLRGDIDFVNAAGVRRAIEDEIRASRPGAVRVDLTAVPFLDSSGIEALVVAHRLAGSLGVPCTVVGPSRPVYEHLRLIGLAELFDIQAPQPSD
jgi:anti-sigma B factor antagonist